MIAKMCAECGKKPSFFRVKCGRRVRKDKRHDLCFKCSRAQINRMWSQRLRAVGE